MAKGAKGATNPGNRNGPGGVTRGRDGVVAAAPMGAAERRSGDDERPPLGIVGRVGAVDLAAAGVAAGHRCEVAVRVHGRALEAAAAGRAGDRTRAQLSALDAAGVVGGVGQWSALRGDVKIAADGAPDPQRAPIVIRARSSARNRLGCGSVAPDAGGPASGMGRPRVRIPCAVPGRSISRRQPAGPAAGT